MLESWGCCRCLACAQHLPHSALQEGEKSGVAEYLSFNIVPDPPHQELAVLPQAQQLLPQHQELEDVALVAVVLPIPAPVAYLVGWRGQNTVHPTQGVCRCRWWGLTAAVHCCNMRSSDWQHGACPDLK